MTEFLFKLNTHCVTPSSFCTRRFCVYLFVPRRHTMQMYACLYLVATKNVGGKANKTRQRHVKKRKIKNMFYSRRTFHSFICPIQKAFPHAQKNRDHIIKTAAGACHSLRWKFIFPVGCCVKNKW